MKWDYASVVVWGLDEKGIDGIYRFDKAVVELARRLNADVEKTDPLNGYQVGFKVQRQDEILLKCFANGTGSAQGSCQFLAASTASEVYPLIQELHPRHSVSRLDAAEDYRGKGTWTTLEAMLTKVCKDHNVSMAPFGEGHVRPDGSRDWSKGRTWYCGSKASPFRIVLYEKGLEQANKGVAADPTWVRLEVRVKPSSKAKALLGSLNLKPVDLLGMSRWGQVVGEMMGVQELERVAIGSIWKPNEQEQLALKIVRMFDNGIEKMIEQYTPEQFGQLIFDVHKANREAKDSIEQNAEVATVS